MANKFHKKTLRKMPVTSRELAKLINDANSFVTRAKNLMPHIIELERDSHSLRSHSCEATVKAKERSLDLLRGESGPREIPDEEMTGVKL